MSRGPIEVGAIPTDPFEPRMDPWGTKDPSLYVPTPSAWLWGDQIRLTSERPSCTIVRTPTYATPTAFLLDLMFPDDSTPQQIRITIRRAVDQLGSIVERQFTGGVGFGGVGVPRVWIGHNLAVDVSLEQPFWGYDVEFKAACVPTSCADTINFLPHPPPYGALGGYQTTIVTRIPVSTTPVALLQKNINRRQFFIQNNSTQDLAVLFESGAAASLTPGSERYSILLPGGSFGHYESPIGGYTGFVGGIWRAADPGGEALVTEGLTP